MARERDPSDRRAVVIRVRRDRTPELRRYSIAPVLLGDGVRLYGTPAAPRVDLEPVVLERSGRVIDLRYSLRR